MSKEAKLLTPEQEFEKLLEGLSPEQQAELRKMSGMDNLGGGDALPVLKVSTQEDPDKNGVEIKKGNFVIGQVVKDDVLVEAGTDLGKECEVVIFAAPKQYSFYHKDPKQRCNSNLLFERGDVAVGQNLGFTCSDGTCPHRQEGIPKEQKCGQQIIIYSRLGDKKVVSYHKKSNFMPMNNYLKELGSYPYLFTTKFKTEKAKQGNVTYFVIKPEKGNACNALELKENLKVALETTQGLKDYDRQQKNKQAQLGYKPSGSTEGLGFDSSAGSSKGANAEDAIVFD